eukprot:962319-Karenia_brevis.AAC.1
MLDKFPVQSLHLWMYGGAETSAGGTIPLLDTLFGIEFSTPQAISHNIDRAADGMRGMEERDK